MVRIRFVEVEESDVRRFDSVGKGFEEPSLYTPQAARMLTCAGLAANQAVDKADHHKSVPWDSDPLKQRDEQRPDGHSSQKRSSCSKLGLPVPASAF